MLDKMKQMMEMKKQMDQLKRDLEAITVECSDIRGIKIMINGASNIQSIEIDESFLKPENKEKIESDLLRSFNSAILKSQKAAAQKMRSQMPQGFPGF